MTQKSNACNAIFHVNIVQSGKHVLVASQVLLHVSAVARLIALTADALPNSVGMLNELYSVAVDGVCGADER